MDSILQIAKNQINDLVIAGVKKCMAEGKLNESEIPNFDVEIPADNKNGDFSTNIAMVGARAFKLAPRVIADAIVSTIDMNDTYFEKIEVAGPGFINFFVSQNWFSDVLKTVLEQGENYAKSDYGKGKKVMVEFVSANPTGPMHIGNARGGAIGDCLSEVLKWAGYEVAKEFYVNDAGNQIEKFGLSLSTRYLQIFKGEENVPFPEDAYHGEDIKVHAKDFAEIHGDKYVNESEEVRKKALVDFALPKNIEALRTDLAKYKIHYDKWFLESELHKSGEVDATINLLKERGLTYEQDGALFYKASEFGGEKDEVLVRQNGYPTYFAADIAYHYNKFAVRNFDIAINIWGADHHGHVARIKGAMDAVGLNGDALDIVLMQLVRLMKGKELVRVSKRTGKSITLSNLLEEVPIDAARFFFNMREASSQMDFDLDLAIEKSNENPVYYVQYAHARICGIIEKLSGEGVQISDTSACDFSLLTDASERELIRHMALLPSEIIEAAKSYDPAAITRYIVSISTLFHKFYNNCRVSGEVEALTKARLSLCIAVKTIIANLCALIKINAPESM